MDGAAYLVVHGGLWRSDGTVAGTVAMGGASSLSSLTAFGNSIVYSANDALLGVEPFISDGTANGTRVLRDIMVADASSQPFHLTPALGGLWFFTVNDNGTYTLWFTSGTGASTRAVKDLRGNNGLPVMVGECAGLLYFGACEVPGSCGIWRTAGTPSGTYP